MRKQPLPDLHVYKNKPEEFYTIMRGDLILPGRHFVYLQEDHEEIMALLNDKSKEFVTIYGVVIQRSNIVLIEEMDGYNTVMNQSPLFLHAEMKVRFGKFKQDNDGRDPTKEEMIDITLQVMREAQEQVATQTDEQIDEELAEAKKSIPNEQ